MSKIEKLQETLNCINQNLIVLIRDQQLLYTMLEKLASEAKEE